MALQDLTYSLLGNASDTQELTRISGSNYYNINIDDATGTFELSLEASPDGSTYEELHNSGTVSAYNDKKLFVGPVYTYVRLKITDKSGLANSMDVYVTPFSIRVGSLDDLTDVDVPAPSDNEILTYNATTGKWESGNVLEDLGYIDFDLNPGVTPIEGRLYWDATCKTLSLGMAGGVASLQLGQEVYIRAKNNSGGVITNGTPVYIDGADGINPTVNIANAASHAISTQTLAIATEEIAIGQFGYCTTFGLVRDIDTDFVAADGDPAYLSTTPGELATALPTQPNSQVFIGYVTRKHATEGVLFIKIVPQPNIEELSNILISGVADGEILQWGNTDSRWGNVEGSPKRSEWLQNGVVDNSDSTLAFDDATRVFTINRTGASFDYYVQGVLYTVITDDQATINTVTLTDDEGLWAVYYDGATLTAIRNPSTAQFEDLMMTKCLLGLVYYDATNNLGILYDERHGFQMSPWTHRYIHESRGMAYIDGLALADFVISDGTDNEDAQFSIAAGECHDEDLEIDLTAINKTTGNIIFYRVGADWRWTTQAGFKCITSDGTNATRLAYDNAGSLTEVTDNNFVLVHVFATNSYDGLPISVVGQAEYATRNAARAGAETEISNLILGTLPSKEMKPIASIIYQTKDTYGNDVNAKVVQTAAGDNYVDWRTSALSAGVAAADHGSLGGLADDDHTQYYLADGSRSIGGNVLPDTDDTYYIGKNDDDSPFAWKGVILKDTTNGKYYRIEIINGVVTATDLTD